MLRPRALLVALALGAVAITGCGSSGGTSTTGPQTRPVSLVLDFTPNAVHAGIYAAIAGGYGRANGIDLTANPPGASTDSLKELIGGRADASILDIHDLALARQQGRDIVGIAPIVQVPLAAVLAQHAITTPKDLDGRRAGVTGLPSDDAVLDTVVRGGGGDPSTVKRITIGFNAVSALVGGKVDAATAFWNVEGLEVKAKRPGIREFRVDRYGAPSYPELVLAVRRQTLAKDPALVRGLVATLRRGYADAIAHPAAAVAAMVKRVPGLNAGDLRKQLAAVTPAFTQGVPAWGAFNRANLAKWSVWEAKVGITKQPPNVSQAFWFGATPPTDAG